MLLLGPIVRVQIQRQPLKVAAPPGAAHHRVFEPAPLLEVPALAVAPEGVLGLCADGSTVVDVHHRAHPASRNQGANGISVGFTSHYAAMRARFGEHLEDGIAGENLLVDAAETFAPDLLARGLAVETESGVVDLSAVIVAEPCVEFTRFALRLALDARDPAAVTDGLRALRTGTRGFYATCGERCLVRPGDRVFVHD